VYSNRRHQRCRQHASFSGRAALETVESHNLAILRLNIEGATPSKMIILEQLAKKNSATVVILQETHKEDPTILKIPGYVLAGHTKSKHHGLATLIKEDVPWTATGQSATDSTVEWLTTKVLKTTIVNVYKPPANRQGPDSLPMHQHQLSMLGTSTALIPSRDTSSPTQMASS